MVKRGSGSVFCLWLSSGSVESWFWSLLSVVVVVVCLLNS